MKKYIATMLLLLCVVLHLTGVAESSDWRSAVVTNCEEWVSLRSEPSAGSARIARIPLGAEVLVIPQRSEFCPCRYNQQTGYVLSKYTALNAGYKTALGMDAENPAAEADSRPDAGRPECEDASVPIGSRHATGMPGWINSLDEDACVEPNAEDFITLRAGSGSGPKLRKIRNGERMRVLGWDGQYCWVEVVSTRETGYVNSGYIAATDLDASRWPYDYETMLEDQVAAGKNVAVQSEKLDKTADGREIIVTRIGNEQARHHILIQCAMHAREIMTSRLGGDLIWMLLNDYPEGIEDVCVHVLPLVNPDGQQIALYGAEAIRDAGMREAVYGWLSKSNGTYRDWKANAHSVDVNRNFDAGWSRLTGRTVGSARYRGPIPHSERESRALVDYVARYPFDCTVSIHSYGSLIYWMGAEGTLKQRTKSLADAVSKSTGYKPANSESNVERGGFKDWALEKAGIPSVTIEIGAVDSVGSLEEYSAIALRFRRFIPDLAKWAMNNV